MKGIMTTTKTTTGKDAYWHFHAIGVGVIFNYSINAMQVLMTCEHTGQVIDCQDFYEQGGLTQDEFRKICSDMYQEVAADGKTINLDYMDDPTIVGDIGVDFNILKN